AINRAEAESASTELVELDARETLLLRDKDRLLGKQLRNVDPLAQDVRDLRATREHLDPLRHAAWFDPSERALVGQRLDECKAALAAQETRIEALKAQSARGRNSSDNFPVFAASLVKTAPRALQKPVQQLQLLVAQFEGGHDGNAEAIRKTAAQIQA